MEINWVWLLLTAFVIVIDFLTSDLFYSWLVIGFIPAFLLGFIVTISCASFYCSNSRRYFNCIRIKIL